MHPSNSQLYVWAAEAFSSFFTLQPSPRVLCQWAIAGGLLAYFLSRIVKAHPEPHPHSHFESNSYAHSDYSSSSQHYKSRVKPKTAAFRADRLTSTTFRIIETDDIFNESPFIYVRLVQSANTILILDTGCGGRSKYDVEVTSLREFIETVRIADNGNMPLNESKRMKYIVVLSHCHYDHILGVEDFAVDSPILVSGNAPDFISHKNLPKHSLCLSLGLPTPSYHPVLVPDKHAIRATQGRFLRVTLLHTPGHVPDEIALWDTEELMLYVGDTLYEWEHIIFPIEGSIIQWFATVARLIAYVSMEAGVNAHMAKICCGHRTAVKPALEVLRAAQKFMLDVRAGKEPERTRMMKRGEMHVEYVQDSKRFSMICPERLVNEAREAAVDKPVEVLDVEDSEFM